MQYQVCFLFLPIELGSKLITEAGLQDPYDHIPLSLIACAWV